MTQARFALIRDMVLLIGGLALIWYETAIAPAPRLPLVALAAGMVWLPATFIADRFFAQPPAAPAEPAATPGPPDSPEAKP